MCVGVYADLIGSMTIHLMANGKTGDTRIKNELSRKIDINPSSMMTRQQFISAVVWQLLMDGNCVVYPVYDGDYLTDLRLFEPSKTSIIDRPDGGYFIRYGDRTFNPDEVLHFVYRPDPEHPYRGMGNSLSLRDVVGSLRQADQTRRALLQSPAPSIIVKVDGLSEDFASSEGRRRLSEQYFEASEAGRPWFIPSEAFAVDQVKPLTMQDLALEPSMTLDKRALAAIFGVPPHMVGVGEYSAGEVNHFISTNLMAVAKAIEQELTRKLLISPSLYFRFNPRSLYSYSTTELVSAGVSMIDRNAMRRNELRDWIGLPPDPEMDELLALENYLPVSELGNQKKLKGGDENNES